MMYKGLRESYERAYRYAQAGDFHVRGMERRRLSITSLNGPLRDGQRVTDRALFVGRFQPFHLGHLDVARRLAGQHAELVVAIGSAQVSHSEKNPFTAGERIEMVHGALRDARITNALVVALPDVGRNSVWVSHVKSYVPAFQALYTNNPLMTRLFQEAGHKVLPAPFHERETYEGTRIRALIREGGDWRALVPPGVARVIEACDGPARLRTISRDGVTVEGRDPSV